MIAINNLLIKALCNSPIFILMGLAGYIICRILRKKDVGAHIFGAALFSWLLALIFDITGLPDPQHLQWGNAAFNLIPFAYIRSAPFQYAANLILFVPVGFFLPLLWKKMDFFRKTVPVGFFLSLTIELLQLFTFRAVDIDDLIMNTLGAMTGYLIYRLFRKILPLFSLRFRSPKRPCLWTKHGWLLCLVIVLLIRLTIGQLQYNLVLELFFS